MWRPPSASWRPCLNGEIDTLGYPKAALFAFCVALVSYNVMSVVKAALRSVHGEEAVEEVSFYYLADEVAGTHRGMMIAIPEEEWAVFHGLTAAAFGGVLLDLAAGVRLSSYRKQVVARSVRRRSGRAGRRSSTSPRRSYWRSGKGVHNSTFKALGRMGHLLGICSPFMIPGSATQG